MKNKILLGIILVLVFAIVIVNFCFAKKDSNNDKQMVLGVQTFDVDKYDFSKKLSSIPKKSLDFYESDYILAQNYILIDFESGTILTQKDAHQQVSIASTTKIMTAIIALENYDLEEQIVIKDRPMSSEESMIGLITDDSLNMKDLLSALLISSANDAAYALADHMGYDKFIQRMNDKAQYFGLDDTLFKDPAGFSDEGKSSASDMAYITKYALANDTFKDIIKTTQATIVSSNGLAYELKNSNRLIKNDEPLYYSPSIGGKTGFTYEAGHCLVSAATSNEHTLIAVVLHTDYDTNEASAEESKKLLEWGFDNYTWDK